MKIVTRIILTLLCLNLLSGCVLFHGYAPPLQQGNVVTAQKAAALRVGMSKDQVLAIMGTPVATNTFRDNEWNYVFTYQKYGHRLAESRVIVHFNNGQVVSIDKDIDPALTEDLLMTPPPRHHFWWR